MVRISISQALKFTIVDMIKLNKTFFYAPLSVTVLSIIFFILNGLYPTVNRLLASSISTPWGVITSVFAHSSLSHIGFNLIYLWVWTILITFENDILKYNILKREEIGKRLKFITIFAFGSTIISDFIWSIILRPGSTTLGSSGVVYALSGACLVTSLMNISYVVKRTKFSELRNKINLMLLVGNLLMNVIVFWFIFNMVTIDTTAFFGFEDVQINSFVHWTSFIIAFFTVFAFEYYTFHLPTLIKNSKLTRNVVISINKFTYGLSELLGIKRRFLLWFIIFSLILFASQTFLNHKVDRILTEVEKTPNIDAFIVPFVQKEVWGDYLPLMVINSGDLPLYNITIGVKSCVMSNLNQTYEVHNVPILLPYNEYVIRFGNKETVKDFERLWCTPSSDYPYPSFSFSPTMNQTQVNIMTTCGYCQYTVKIFSDKINRTIENWYRSPIDLTITVEPPK